MTETEDLTEKEWTFGEPWSPALEETPDGKIWQQGGVTAEKTAIVHTRFGEFREAKFLGITNSFGACKVFFEGDTEPTRLHYNQIGRYVTPELAVGQRFFKDGKFYRVIRKHRSGVRYQLVLQRCHADGGSTPNAFFFEYFDIKKFKRLV